MYKKILCLYLSLILTIFSFAGCAKNEEEGCKETTQIQESIVDVKHPKLNFGFKTYNVKIPLQDKDTKVYGEYDAEGNYVYRDTKNFLLTAVSTYYVNENNDYDMLRCNLNNIREAKDIFENLSYKVEFCVLTNEKKYVNKNNLFNFENGFFEYNVISNNIGNIDNKEAAQFEGTVKDITSKKETEYKIFGYSIWNKENPVMFYVLSLDGKEISEESRQNIKKMAFSYVENPENSKIK